VFLQLISVCILKRCENIVALQSALCHTCIARKMTVFNFHYSCNNISCLYLWKIAEGDGASRWESVNSPVLAPVFGIVCRFFLLCLQC
jgi:hypothetical protein